MLVAHWVVPLGQQHHTIRIEPVFYKRVDRVNDGFRLEVDNRNRAFAHAWQVDE